MATSVAAHAQSTPLTQYNATTGYGTLTTDGLTFQITSCTYTAQGSSSGVACSPGSAGNLPAGDVLQAVINGSAATIEVVNANGGAVLSLSSITTDKPYNKADIAFTVNVTPATTPSQTTITNINTTVTGSATNSGELPLITAGLSWTTGTTNLSLNADASGATSGPVSFAATNTLSVSYDLALNANTGTSPGDTLILTNTPTTYSPAPEPASLLLLGPGAFVVSRLRRTRAASTRRTT